MKDNKPVWEEILDDENAGFHAFLILAVVVILAIVL